MSAPATGTAAAAAQPPIAFRPEGPSAGAHAGGSLVLALALLAVVTVLLAYARRRGWLRAWADAPSTPAGSRLQIASRLRLSPRTVVYEVRDGEARFHVVESTAHVVVQRDP